MLFINPVPPPQDWINGCKPLSDGTTSSQSSILYIGLPFRYIFKVPNLLSLSSDHFLFNSSVVLTVVIWVEVTAVTTRSVYGSVLIPTKSFQPPSFSKLQSVNLLYLSKTIVTLKSLVLSIVHNCGVKPLEM